ncbi:hypothetical protein B0H10DRAFT_1968816 [Mycena sp. CBHHK59/15]|nr:hypothetical protein B0H10DRAFT_1968816 [Mycena sp. CBHHK59/15]
MWKGDAVRNYMTQSDICFQPAPSDIAPWRTLQPEYQVLVQRVSAALCNPIVVNWDFAKFSSSTKAQKERNFKSPMLGMIEACTTLVDSEGWILAWILPHIVSESHMVQMRIHETTKNLEKLLASSIKNAETPSQPPSWRSVTSNFVKRTMQPGSVNFSSGWFGVGHASPQYALKPSNNLSFQSAREWLTDIGPVEKLVNLILGLTHLELWEADEKAHAKLSSLSETWEIAGLWESVFSGITVIANWQTIPHIDIGGS